jgi:hypothetical protein
MRTCDAAVQCRSSRRVRGPEAARAQVRVRTARPLRCFSYPSHRRRATTRGARDTYVVESGAPADARETLVLTAFTLAGLNGLRHRPRL